MKQVVQSLPERSGFNFGVIAVVVVLIMVFVMGLVKIYSPDLGFHLKSAQWMLDNKAFIYKDSFDYGSEGNNYYNLQWLYQLLVYALYNQSESVLVIVNALLITVSIALVFLRFSRNNGWSLTGSQMGFFAFLALLFVQPLSVEIRPHVLSWIFLNLILLTLESYKRGKIKGIVFLPVIILFWVNTHSLAILGLATIAMYNTGIYLEKKKVDKKLLLFSIFSFVAFLANPYFFEGLIYPLTQFGFISGNNIVKLYFGEMQSPFTGQEIAMLGKGYFSSPLLIIHLSALFILLSLIRSMRKKRYTDSVLLAGYFFILYLAHKNYGYFLMVSLPLIGRYTIEWIEFSREKAQTEKKKAGDKRKFKLNGEITSGAGISPVNKIYLRFAIAAVIVAFFISITCMTNAYPIFRHSPYRYGFTEDKDQLPVEATAFLNQYKIRGRIFNHLDFGGYLLAHYPGKVFIDGRMDVLPEDFFIKYYKSLTQPNGLKNLLNEYNPDIVIFPYVKASNWWNYFLSNTRESGYRAVYFDGLSVIYLKSSFFPQLPELSKNDIRNDMDKTAYSRLNQCIEHSKPGRWMVLFNGIWSKQSYSIADQNKATYCFTSGYDTAALNYSVMGIEKSTLHTPAIFKNLSIYFQENKMYGQAQLCEEKSE